MSNADARTKKVPFFDKGIFKRFLAILGVISSITSTILFCIDIPSGWKTAIAIVMGILVIVLYIGIYIWANSLKKVEINVEGSSVIVKEGDLFEEEGFKAIAFNEYFDTKVDEKIISSHSLNGIFINKFFPDSPNLLDEHIEQYQFADCEVLERNEIRKSGKMQKYNIGTICVYEDFLLTAFTKFDERNSARLTMPEYLTFLNTFWDNVNTVYGQQCVSVPVFGSGITRIKEHRGIEDEDLLKIMLWTFKVSETRFKYPAKLTIIIHKEKMRKINLFDILSIKNGL